mmetsp:Transcript_15948/g.30020  ORF Transcript_15948/g.30020 Transcript_15948/m.30020 type:complete len:141 (-) Transcript_15948:1030-1452(-)
MMRCSASTATRSTTANRVSTSWVTITTVRPSSWRSRRSSRTNCLALSGSSPAVGSSRNSSCGSRIRARASDTRLTMPPDSSAGRLNASAGLRPTWASLSMTSGLTRLSGTLLSSRSGSAMLSNTFSAENSAPCWNSTPQR